MPDEKRIERSPETIREEISIAKNSTEEKISLCKLSAKKLATAKKVLQAAKNKYSRKASAKNEANLDAATEEFESVLRGHVSIIFSHSALVDKVLSLYDELISVTPRKINKIIKEAEKYGYAAGEEKQKLRAYTKDIPEVADALMQNSKQSASQTEKQESEPLKRENVPPRDAYSEKKVPENLNYINYQGMPVPPPQPQPYYPPMPYYMPPQPSGVNVAPATVDISAIVEDAVKSAMEKFKVAFDSSADEYIEAVKLSSTNIAEMEEKIAEDERYIVDKLASVADSLKALIDEITEMGAETIKLNNTQEDCAKLQKKINDMQRALAREMQGVQVHQRVINQDQAAIAEEQVVILEQERATAEAQKFILLARENPEAELINTEDKKARRKRAKREDIKEEVSEKTQETETAAEESNDRVSAEDSITLSEEAEAIIESTEITELLNEETLAEEAEVATAEVTETLEAEAVADVNSDEIQDGSETASEEISEYEETDKTEECGPTAETDPAPEPEQKDEESEDVTLKDDVIATEPALEEISENADDAVLTQNEEKVSVTELDTLDALFEEQEAEKTQISDEVKLEELKADGEF